MLTALHSPSLGLSAIRTRGPPSGSKYPRQPELEPHPCTDEETKAGSGTRRARTRASPVIQVSPYHTFSSSPGSGRPCLRLGLSPPCSDCPPPLRVLSFIPALHSIPSTTPDPRPTDPGPQPPRQCKGVARVTNPSRPVQSRLSVDSRFFSGSVGSSGTNNNPTPV